MADISDVEQAFVNSIAAIVYPNGTSQPSVANCDVRIFRGWPVSAALDADLQAGKCNVSVYTRPGVGKNTTRYPREEQELTAPVHTLSATVSDKVITIGGTVSASQNVIVLCGRQHSFAYAVQQGDTLASIATALAALIAAVFPGTASSGPMITIDGHPGLVAVRIAGVGTTWTEQRRQEEVLQVTCWCPTPALRDALAPPIDLAFAQIDFMTMPDQGAARVRYERMTEEDSAEKVQLYRRDLFYSVEYATATIETRSEIGTVSVNTAAGACRHGEFETFNTTEANY